MDFSYGQTEKLKGKKLIQQLFDKGKSVSVFPLRLVYLKTDFEDSTPLKIGVSVSKKHFKHAVKRNKIKRHLREAYRLNKQMLISNSGYAFMIIYGSNTIPTFSEINNKTQQLFHKFITNETKTPEENR